MLRLRFVPRGAMFEDRIQDREELMHAGREGHLFRFAGLLQPLIKGPDDGIVSRRNDGSHVEHGSHLGTATPDGAASMPGSAVTTQRRHPHEGRNLFMRQRAQFRQIRQHGRGQDRPYTRDAAQQIIFLAPHGTLLNGLRQIPVRVRQF